MTDKEKDCRDCKHYYTDYDCREFCEGRDMFEPKKTMTNAEKYKEVFGYDIKDNTIICTAEEFDPEECKYCLNRHKGVVGCEQWMKAEYKERTNDR